MEVERRVVEREHHGASIRGGSWQLSLPNIVLNCLVASAYASYDAQLWRHKRAFISWDAGHFIEQLDLKPGMGGSQRDYSAASALDKILCVTDHPRG